MDGAYLANRDRRVARTVLKTSTGRSLRFAIDADCLRKSPGRRRDEEFSGLLRNATRGAGD